jgi:hypothetical protein
MFITLSPHLNLLWFWNSGKLITLMYYIVNLTCGFGTQLLSPFSVTRASTPSHVETSLLLTSPIACTLLPSKWLMY